VVMVCTLPEEKIEELKDCLTKQSFWRNGGQDGNRMVLHWFEDKAKFVIVVITSTGYTGFTHNRCHQLMFSDAAKFISEATDLYLRNR
jgi:hypothetical protein